VNELQQRRPVWVYAAIAVALIALAAAIQLAMGRLLVSDSGRFMLWSGRIGPENSQQFSDWYSFSHLIHGMAFYGLLHWLGGGQWSRGARFVLATLMETAWEVIENTPLVINRYREHTAALGYAGDTVLNSASDTLFAIAGFFLAWRLPVWATLALIALIEVVSAIVIRDNLTLNIVMLLLPIEAIKRWQAGE
jgi:hypothetical protein